MPYIEVIRAYTNGSRRTRMVIIQSMCLISLLFCCLCLFWMDYSSVAPRGSVSCRASVSNVEDYHSKKLGFVVMSFEAVCHHSGFSVSPRAILPSNQLFVRRVSKKENVILYCQDVYCSKITEIKSFDGRDLLVSGHDLDRYRVTRNFQAKSALFFCLISFLFFVFLWVKEHRIRH